MVIFFLGGDSETPSTEFSSSTDDSDEGIMNIYFWFLISTIFWSLTIFKLYCSMFEDVAELVDDEPLSFIVVVRNSHLDNRCHGPVSTNYVNSIEQNYCSCNRVHI